MGKIILTLVVVAIVCVPLATCNPKPIARRLAAGSSNSSPGSPTAHYSSYMESMRGYYPNDIGCNATATCTNLDLDSLGLPEDPRNVTEAQLKDYCMKMRDEATCQASRYLQCLALEMAPYRTLLESLDAASRKHWKVCDVPDLNVKFQTLVACGMTIGELFEHNQTHSAVTSLTECGNNFVQYLMASFTQFSAQGTPEPVGGTEMILNVCCKVTELTDCVTAALRGTCTSDAVELMRSVTSVGLDNHNCTAIMENSLCPLTIVQF